MLESDSIKPAKTANTFEDGGQASTFLIECIIDQKNALQIFRYYRMEDLTEIDVTDSFSEPEGRRQLLDELDRKGFVKKPDPSPETN